MGTAHATKQNMHTNPVHSDMKTQVQQVQVYIAVHTCTGCYVVGTQMLHNSNNNVSISAKPAALVLTVQTPLGLPGSSGTAISVTCVSLVSVENTQRVIHYYYWSIGYMHTQAQLLFEIKLTSSPCLSTLRDDLGPLPQAT